MEFSEYLRFLLALCFVLSLIGILAVLARRMGWTHGNLGYTKPDSRLQIVESLPLDTRRRAMIIRRDNVEHLVILGTSNELLIETAITPVDKVSPPQADIDLKSKIVSGLFGTADSKAKT